MKLGFPFDLGQFQCVVIDDGVSDYTTADFLFSGAPEIGLHQQLKKHSLKTERIECSNNCLIINTGSTLILVDTGCGDSVIKPEGTQKTGRLLSKLQLLGFDPIDFDIVVLTHHHYDHIGGCCNEKGHCNFPNARFFMSRAEWEYGVSQNDLSKKMLMLIRNRLELLDRDTAIGEGIKAIITPGHSPGQIVLDVSSKDDRLLCCSDVLVHPIHAEFPDWTMSHEHDRDLSMVKRREILLRASAKKMLIHAYHIKYPGLGYVVQKEHTFRWNPFTGEDLIS
ncbi:MBL fold metallo-hydrolase [Acidobacteriota bacterium]